MKKYIFIIAVLLIWGCTNKQDFNCKTCVFTLPGRVIHKNVVETGSSYSTPVVIIHSYTEGYKLYRLYDEKPFVELEKDDTLSMQVDDGEVVGYEIKK